MLLLLGFGNKDTKVLGRGNPIVCPNCNNERRWQVVEVKKKISLYFIPVATYARDYYYLCPVCRLGEELQGIDAARKTLQEAKQ